ncbi:ribosomal large subunit pseudouridine synthase B [Desulfocurvibacter africanus PCS]|uniref:Pseudouridine synthase n=1 Tax=Desulfocurvibacter africanus PCS TaxID=1262666 RepID=M5PWZ5_DESAF|nr:pseudouridine synthase [Desulfocurvibacter africanus]EMG38847.1 ribosomal large subunit pseudouridine synthase B [Desulfocurvibacter africanus PCS]
MRLNKALAMAGVCSRRKADELVFAGNVAVNGITASSPGIQVDPQNDIVTVFGKPVAFLPQEGQATEHAYYMLNKPVEVVTTASDPQGRRTVLEILPEVVRKRRVFPVGRLDFFSEGLLLLTSDGDLTYRMTHPRYHLPKVYEVLVRGEVTRDKLEAMRRGMTLAEGEKLAPVEVKVLDKQMLGKTLLELTLIQGINRQIRRMCRDLGLTVLKLRRTCEGPLSLGALPTGKLRTLTPAEVKVLKKAVAIGIPGPE